LIYSDSWNITLKHYDTIPVAEEKGEPFPKETEKRTRKEKKMIDQEIFEALTESLDGDYALEAKVLAAIMPSGW
jgi:hypothetical protein